MEPRKKSEQELAGERKALALRMSIDEVLKTEAGRRLFAHLSTWCGGDESSLARDRSTGGIDTMTTSVNEATRAVYVHLKKLATRELLLKAEELAYNDAKANQPQEERK